MLRQGPGEKLGVQNLPERRPVEHAITEAILDALCQPDGNGNPVKKENIIINITNTKELPFEIYLMCNR